MTTESRPVWARWGGGGIVLAATLLLLATIIEAILNRQSAPVWSGLFAVLLLGSAAAYALAMVPLALGATGSDGIVGTSVVGKLGLLGFGAVFLAAEVSYYGVAYLLPPVDDYSRTNALGFVLGIAQLLLLLVGAVVVIRARIATGAARWALLVFVVVAAVAGGIAQGADSVATMTVFRLISTVTQVAVGLTIAFARVPTRRTATAGQIQGDS